MLGLGETTKAPAGARDKIAMAREMKKKGFYDSEQKRGGGTTQYPSQTIAISLIISLAVIIAFILTGGTSSPLSGMHPTGINNIDSFVTGSDIHAFTGDPDQDKVLTIMGRGLALFALAGIVPLISLMLEKTLLRARVMPHVICWGVTVALMIVYLCIPDNTVGPFLKDHIPFLKTL